MKNSVRLLVAIVATLIASQSFAQTVLAKWTFETSIPASNSAAISGILAESGVFKSTSFASGNHVSSSTAWSNPTGNASNESFSATNWGIGDYFQFATNTIGYDSITVSWDQVGSSTGPKNFSLQYSTDGSNFTTFSSYVVLENVSPNAWSSTTPRPATSYTLNLNALTNINSITGVYFRLTDTSTTSIAGATVSAAGSSRVDNFTISGTAVAAAIPEPSTYAAIFGGVALAGAAYLRRQQAKAAKVVSV